MTNDLPENIEADTPSMPYRAPRRRFLLQTGRAVLGASFFPIAGCSRSGSSTAHPEEQVPTTLTNELEAKIPSLLTARHVLSHTSGLQNWRSIKEPLRIHFDPGTKWLYS